MKNKTNRFLLMAAFAALVAWALGFGFYWWAFLVLIIGLSSLIELVASIATKLDKLNGAVEKAGSTLGTHTAKDGAMTDFIKIRNV